MPLIKDLDEQKNIIAHTITIIINKNANLNVYNLGTCYIVVYTYRVSRRERVPVLNSSKCL